MPLNLLKKYNKLLELTSLQPYDRQKSLKGVFDRDFVSATQPFFYGKPVCPTPGDGEDAMERLFRHLTTVITDKHTRHREFEMSRSIRLHWVRHHLDNRTPENLLVFSVNDKEGERTYLYDSVEHYVVILEPLRNRNGYYLLTAYLEEGKDRKRNKIMKKYERRLPDIL